MSDALSKLGFARLDIEIGASKPRHTDPLYHGRENPRGRPEGSGITVLTLLDKRGRKYRKAIATPLAPEWHDRRITVAQSEADSARFATLAIAEKNARARVRYVAPRTREVAIRNATLAGAEARTVAAFDAAAEALATYQGTECDLDPVTRYSARAVAVDRYHAVSDGAYRAAADERAARADRNVAIARLRNASEPLIREMRQPIALPADHTLAPNFDATSYAMRNMRKAS